MARVVVDLVNGGCVIHEQVAVIKLHYTFVVCWLVIGSFVGLAAAATPHAGSGDDHLVPAKGYVDEAYKALLRRKLFLTSGNYARIVTLASTASVGESAISIYSKSDRSGSPVFVTSTRAARNLWYAENGDDPAFPKGKIRIERQDAPLPKPLAEAISAALKELLDKTRPMSVSGRIAVDPVNIEVSLEKGGVTRRRGLLTPDANGPTTSSFRRLLRSLEAYCKTSSPKTRSELEKKIAADANNLARGQKR